MHYVYAGQPTLPDGSDVHSLRAVQASLALDRAAKKLKTVRLIIIIIVLLLLPEMIYFKKMKMPQIKKMYITPNSTL